MPTYTIHMFAPFGIRPKGTLAARMLPLGQALVQRGHRVTIIAPPVHNPQDAMTTIDYNGVPVIHTQVGDFHQPWSLLQPSLRQPPDIVHVFKPKGFAGLAALLAQVVLPRTRLVIDTDDWEGWGGWNDLLPYPYLAKQLFAWQEGDLPRRAAAVTVASRTLQSQVWGFGVPPERVFYLPNGSQPQKDSVEGEPAPHPTLLLYTRFWEFDLATVVAALVGIVAQHPNVRLLVIGKGEQGQEVEFQRLVARAGLSTNLDYRGWVEPAQIPALVASASIALVPLNDTLINRARCSAKLIELMEAGKALVVANVGQTSEYLRDQVSALLVPPSDSAALARACIALLNNPVRCRELGQAARAAAARFGWQHLAPIAEQAYLVAGAGE
jgi:glycosyltransferase involved in cell wall biosynthesis